MVENYRSSLIWKNFMANAEIAPMLQAIGFVKDTTSTDVKREESPVTKFQLLGNYPNPFNPSTTIKFSLPLMTNVEADVFDLMGRKVKTIVNTVFQTGQHEIVWNGTDDLEQTVASGIYIYWIKANGQILSGKMILQK
jgi:flagellar hook assembly protein FlgD